MHTQQEVTVKELREGSEDTQKPSTFWARKGQVVGSTPLAKVGKKRPFVVVGEGEIMKIAKGTMVEMVRADDRVMAFYAVSKGVVTGPAMVRTTPVEPEDAPSPLAPVSEALNDHGHWAWLLVPVAFLAVFGMNAEHPSGLGFLGVMSTAALALAFAFAAVFVGMCFFANSGNVSFKVPAKPWPPAKRKVVGQDGVAHTASKREEKTASGTEPA